VTALELALVWHSNLWLPIWHHTALLAVKTIIQGFCHLQSQPSLSFRSHFDGEAERSVVQTSSNYSACTSELFCVHFNLLHSQLCFKSGFAVSVKALFRVHLRCVLRSARACGSILLLPGDPGNCALLPECIYCCLYVHCTALPVTRHLWKMPGFAIYIRPPRFATPCHSMYKGSSGQLPWALWGLDSTYY